MHVRPGPMGYAVAVKHVAGQKVVILHLEHATGSTVIPLDPGFAREMADTLLKAATGIEIARI